MKSQLFRFAHASALSACAYRGLVVAAALGVGLLAVGFLSIRSTGPEAFAQMITTSTPFNSVSSGYHETMGTSWSLGGKNWSVGFNQGGNLGQSQFGGSGGGMSTGIGFGNKNFSGQFNGSWTQGSNRSLVSQTPSVTTMNGVPGVISDTQLSPFVISNYPVVGSWANTPGTNFVDPTGGSLTGNWGRTVQNPVIVGALNRVRAAQENPALANDSDRMLQAALGPQAANSIHAPKFRSDETDSEGESSAGERRDRELRNSTGSGIASDAGSGSSAEVAVGSLAEMRKLHQQETAVTQEKSQRYLEKARAATAEGRAKAAKSYYKSAYKFADDATKPEIEKEYKDSLK